ncbi:phage integrase SAM-like domain-containing protein [Novosphingobium sp. 2580]|uniref:Phage integrase SAM-like domain-containing protein n=2 Tax=Novosphingobium album (ex Hu et al. 2023) TaxID=2930093 RepID=A0ABT0B664_9SPHN|nr:phage integrase SAM-like domain-containing protein [Novosphingobium album (ex Hu et al. 2023)]
MFEAKRREIGSGFNADLLAENSVGTTVSKTMHKRSNPSSISNVRAIPGVREPEVNAGPTLAEIYDRYLKDPTKRRSDRTILAHHTTRRVVEDFFGASTPISDLNREGCRKLLETLRWLPVNYSKKCGQLSVREAAGLARQDAGIRTINATNLNAYMARFATMLNWAVSEEYVTRNPARGLQWAETVHPQDRRKPFELWQLQRIFSAPIYTGCRDEQNGYAIPGSVIASGARYWVPLIGLFSGMRLNEVCQLDVTDVRLIEGVPCFVITEESLSGARDKSLKTKTSARIVPIHPRLLDLGIMAFVEGKRRSGSLKLFDDLPPGAKGFRSVAFSRWFSRFLVSVGADAPRTCYHSFRHGFRDAGRNALIDRDITLTLGGWITGGSQSEAADAYGSGYRPQILLEAISAIKFSGLDLSHL